MTRPEIDYDPTSSEARRDRNERAVMTRLAAIQAAGNSDAVLLPSPPRHRKLVFGLAAAALAAAVALVVVFRGDERSEPVASAPSLIVTPVGGSSRFTVGDAVVEAGGDTSVEVERGTGGSTTLVLARGSVDCDVAPRAGRPPFRVVAGEVTVEVVGTRFTVSRDDGSVRVDVTRGKVRVTSRGEQRVLEAGGSWTPILAEAAPVAPEPTAETPPTPPPTPPAAAEPAPEPPAAERTQPARPSSRSAFANAQRLEATKPAEAARAYRAVANGNDVWAALALYSLAEVHAGDEPAAALKDLDELARRFPRNANAEDAAWLRVDVLRKLGRGSDAREAAAAYLRDYPSGTYAKAAARIASP